MGAPCHLISGNNFTSDRKQKSFFFQHPANVQRETGKDLGASCAAIFGGQPLLQKRSTKNPSPLQWHPTVEPSCTPLQTHRSAVSVEARRAPGHVFIARKNALRPVFAHMEYTVHCFKSAFALFSVSVCWQYRTYPSKCFCLSA